MQLDPSAQDSHSGRQESQVKPDNHHPAAQPAQSMGRQSAHAPPELDRQVRHCPTH